jgi:hypothetical protein
MLFAATKTAIVPAFAAALHSQTAPDPAETLSEARLKIGAAMRKLPKYTYVQTIDRSYFTLATEPSSCEQAANRTATEGLGPGQARCRGGRGS